MNDKQLALQHARKKLAHQLAEFVALEHKDGEPFDIDRAAKAIVMALPSTYVEAQAELDANAESKSEQRQQIKKVGPFAALRLAVNGVAQDGSIDSVITAAAAMCTRYRIMTELSNARTVDEQLAWLKKYKNLTDEDVRRIATKHGK